MTRTTKIENPVKAVKDVTFLDIRNDQAIRFNAIQKMVNMTINGTNRALIVSGGPGMGKTHDIMKSVKEAATEGKCEYRLIKGYARPTALYKALFEFKEKGQLVIIDDSDSVFRDEIGLNILKAALDSGEERHISWGSEIKMKLDDETKVPKHFVYEGSMIFITNVCFDEEITKGGKLSTHLKALMSRSHYIDTNIKTNRERLVRLVNIAYDGSMYDDLGIPKESQTKIIRWIEANLDNLREISLRMALKIGQLYIASPNTWKDMAKVTCLKTRT